ncbi:hypothetical protein KP509_04G103200 [Ceratopteris richardii]|uniref:Alcohol dehydrogenase-like N-terminal domain-containing protein n=1 Tax=Ceratopteris richardii TaxID=49495 RepID=A0A8T2V3F5_CERRI|nr:hypothetical protein KP509_04G103200 [Ceratopteris richardii]
MVKAVVLTGPDADLRVEEIGLEPPGYGEVEVRHSAILSTTLDHAFCRPWISQLAETDEDANIASQLFCDVYGSIPGFTAAGVITELGSGVINFRIGQRVVYCNFPTKELLAYHASASRTGGADDMTQTSHGIAPIYMRHASTAPSGSYSEARIIHADNLILLPEHVCDEDAAALLFPFFITTILSHEHILPATFQQRLLEDQKPSISVYPKDCFLGSLICQWALHTGAEVVESSILRESNSNESTEPPYAGDHRRELSRRHGINLVYDFHREISQKELLSWSTSFGIYLSLKENLMASTYWIKENKHLKEEKNLLTILCSQNSHSQGLKEVSSELFSLMYHGKLARPPIKKYVLELVDEAFRDVHQSQVESLSFFLLIPPVLNPNIFPDAS